MLITNDDPIDDFYSQLKLARYQADKHDFASAYLTLATAYDLLLTEHEQAIEEIFELRKKVSLQQ